MNELSPAQKTWLLKEARESISRHMKGLPVAEETPADEALKAKSGVFVTLRLNENLRGCIGMPLPLKPIYIGVRENAVEAAFHDPRFPPLNPAELTKVLIEISVMTPPQPVSGPDKVEVGRDGIIVSRGANRGLLLPQVPLEQGWSRDQYLDYGCLKAGLPVDAWRRGARIEAFQALVFSEEDPRQ